MNWLLINLILSQFWVKGRFILKFLNKYLTYDIFVILADEAAGMAYHLLINCNANLKHVVLFRIVYLSIFL